MKFRYINDEPAEPIQFYGFTWVYGDVHDVTNELFVSKLKTNKFFEVVDGEEPPKNKGGRARKIVTVEAETNGDDQNAG